MKRCLVLVLPFLILHSASAFEAEFPAVISQGKAMEVLVPKSNLTALEGTIGTQTIKFFEEYRTPSDDDLMTRGAFLELLFANHEFPEIQTFAPVQFADIEGDESFADAVLRAKALGYVSGYEDGLFHPQDPLTRAQAAKVLMAAFAPTQVLRDIPVFRDLSPRHLLAKEMFAAIRAQLFRGYGDGTIKMDRFMTVGEAETLTKRATGKEELVPRSSVAYFRGFAGLHRVNDFGDKQLVLTGTKAGGTQIQQGATVRVEKVRYPRNSFSLPPSKTALFENTAYNKTWAMIDAAKQTTASHQLWEGNFIIPTKGAVSMGFGETVFINGKLSGSHFGIDYANSTGTPVYASNSGRVVLAAYTPSYGNTIIIDHGLNVFTMYMHMSKLQVAEAQDIQKGALIGNIGATGVATGPHLHFNHFVGGVIVDSLEWYRGDF